MQYIPDINEFYVSNSAFVLIDKLGNYYDCRQNIEIDILYQSNVKKVWVLWLYLYLRFKIDATISWDDITFIKINDTTRKFPYKCIFKRAYIVNSCYRIIPSFPQYAISVDGACINRSTLNKLTPRKNAYGYHVVSIKDPVTDEYRDVGIHWLVANAWINKNQNNSAVTVNHKDTNKLNNHADNLEWVTYKNNVVHAKEHGIVGSLFGVKLTNMTTHDELYFDNMTSAAAYIDVDVSVIKSAKFNGNRIIKDIWNIEFVSNGNTQYTAPSSYRNRKIPIEVCKDGELIGEVKSLRDLNIQTGICRASLSRLLNSNGKYALHGYALRRKSSEPWPKITNISQYKAVEVTDALGDVHNYSSIKDASVALHLTKSTIKRMLKHPKPDDTLSIKLIST